MAGDWIPRCKGLNRKPEVLAVARITGLTRHTVADLLMDFWEWADSETDSGLLPNLTIAELSQAIPGTDERFWLAVVQAGWLLVGNTGLTIPNFDRWLGRSAKKRLQKNRRQSDWRAGMDGGDVDASASTQAPTTEQNSTEEKKNTPLCPPEGGKDLFGELVASAESKTDSQGGTCSGKAPRKQPPKRIEGAPTAAELQAAWNTHAHLSGWPACHEMGEARMKSFRLRVQTPFWVQNWQAALTKAGSLIWLRGENRRQWVADIDWFLRPRTVARLLEGKYDDRPAPGTKPDGVAEFLRERGER